MSRVNFFFLCFTNEKLFVPLHAVIYGKPSKNENMFSFNRKKNAHKTLQGYIRS